MPKGLENLLPGDRYDRELIGNVRPPDWKNPTPAPVYNLVVLGAGIAGLVAAETAALLGAKVAIIEKRLIGGDCLNLGCVPSKTIISSSRVSEEVRDAPSHGVNVICGSETDFKAVMERMRRLRARISRHDSAARFRDMGVDVFLGEGRFTGKDSVDVAGLRLKFVKALIATGARPFHPPIPGLAEVGYQTNETVFNLTARPQRFAVLGGGAIGCELAQAFGRLGCRVSILQNKPRLLYGEDPDASDVIQRAFEREGIDIILGDWAVTRVEKKDGAKLIHMEKGGLRRHVPYDEFLVSTGRVPTVSGLGLDAAGVEYDLRSGVKVDDFMRTTNPDIYAAGDVCLRYKFSHTAEAAARLVVHNALLGGAGRFSGLAIPWCTFTDPEVAHVGGYEADAKPSGILLETYTQPLAEVDRAVLEGEEEGFVRLHVVRGTDRIFGATIVARRAGEMIGELTVAMQSGVGMKALSHVVRPYPTFLDGIKGAADRYARSRLTSDIKGVAVRWMEMGRKKSA